MNSISGIIVTAVLLVSILGVHGNDWLAIGEEPLTEDI